MEELFRSIKSGFEDILGRSSFIREKIESVHVILNPKAGGFSNKKKMEDFLRLLKGFASAARNSKIESHSVFVTVCSSSAPGQAGIIAAGIVERNRKNSRSTLIVSMGGDGTHQEVLSGLMTVEERLLENVVVFRFPAGTGNDAADAWDQTQALQTLGESRKTSKTGAIAVKTPLRSIMYSFNIASLGLDAYVVHLTNKFKSKIPGNSYKIFADIGVVLYGVIHGFHPMRVSRYGTNGNVTVEERCNGITVMGVSGFRTYGAEKWVLPDERNYCSIKNGSLIDNMKFKTELFKAKHPNLPNCTMDRVHAIEIELSGKIPMQLDGQVTWLEAGDFPLKMETIKTGIQVLSAKEVSVLEAYSQNKTIYSDDHSS